MSMITEMIEYGKNGDKVPAFMARPDDTVQHPGVIVIQEWWGLNDHIKDVTSRMAEAGYVAISPDLYRGQVAKEPDEAQKLAMDLVRDDALADISAGVQYLLAQDYVVPTMPFSTILAHPTAKIMPKMRGQKHWRGLTSI